MMMKKLWNEYGLIAVLLVISVGGYLSLGDQKEDFLSDPLDAIGTRFAELMEDDKSKADFSESYAEFKKKVKEGKVAPEQVESVAASILNLKASGAALTLEDAEMVISLATEPDKVVLPVPAPPVAPDPSVDDGITPGWRELPASSYGYYQKELDVSPQRYRLMGERMKDVFALADELDHMAGDTDNAEEFRSHIRFAFRDGIGIVVDSAVVKLWKGDALRTLTQGLERRRMVIFQNGTSDAPVKWAEMLQKDRLLLEKARAYRTEIGTTRQFLASLERLNKLQEMGMVVSLDTAMFRHQFEESIQLIMEELGDLELEESEEEGVSAGVKVNSN